MTRDEHEQTALMGGSAFQETGMDDYLTRVAEAVRDACAAEAFMETTLAVEYVSAACPGEIISNMILNNIDLQAVIASVPRPEPVAWIIDWPEAPELGHYLAEEPSPAGRSRGLYAEPVAAQSAVPVIPAEKFPPLDQSWSANTEYIAGWNACRDAMLATAPEAPQVADDAATLRSAIRAMAAMLQAREWAEHVSNDPDVTDLEVQITELVGTATKLREQNATLVAALMPFAFICKEGVVTKNYVTVTTCAEYFNRAEKALAALASAKGGAA